MLQHFIVWCMFICASYYKRREENQLDVTECLIALIICSTCFGHLYAYHQELETILVLLPHMVCNALVAGGRLLGAEQQAMSLGWGKLCDWVAQFLTPSTWRSLSTSSFHLFLGLSFLLVPSSSGMKNFLGIPSSSILSRWPNQLIRCPFIHFTIFSPLLISSSSRFVRLFPLYFSYLVPYIHPNIFLSKINRVTIPYVTHYIFYLHILYVWPL